jgi:hypothetical protein
MRMVHKYGEVRVCIYSSIIYISVILIIDGVIIIIIIIFIIYLFILTAKGLLPGGSGTTIRHNTQVTHHTK